VSYEWAVASTTSTLESADSKTVTSSAEKSLDKAAAPRPALEEVKITTKLRA
jgi:hypothetical protein